jgi:cytoskeleton protein RodZ
MASIGTTLRAARERSGISVDDAARRLHIRAMFVEAMEREDWSTVGEPVYVRGFIKNYARLVAVDPHDLVDAFNDQVGVDRQVAPTEVVWTSVDRRPRFRYPVLMAVLSLVALFIVVKLVWTIATPNAAGRDELHPSGAAALVAQTATTPALRATADAAAQGVDLRLQITQPCWLSVTVDGKRVVYQTLPAGTVKEFKGVREIRMRAGNAGGVVATIDGQPLGTLGGAGEVQDRVFAANVPIGSAAAHE